MGNYTTVIFDLDGTLLATLEDLTDSVNYALAFYHFPLKSIEEVRQFVGNGVRRLMELSVPNGTQNPKFEETFDLFKKHYNSNCQNKTKPYDGIYNMLSTLLEHQYKIAIVSNKIHSAVAELNQYYFKDFVTVAIGEKEGIAKKPAPDTVNEALRLLGSTNEEAIYIGDSDVDIETAKNAKMPCISVTWGFRDKNFLLAHDAKILIDRPEELLATLENIE
ncbi:HAD family hydrolase [Velocimicrobium porci]|uniref:HAD family hydrolase n=1 Tax=Velocimicrobium porci TaxID=2606634 RepID=A0A6L5XZ55_9FIRM|nr:HAD family hydrolase [Velocimicrobium porci]MSS64130.1 HAD family hydrolase [Velocimicrobium porci]